MPLRVLIVDDEQGMRAALKEVLSRLQYETETAEDGYAAMELLDAAEKAGRPFSLVLSDVRMPKMDGLELLQRIQSRPTPPPVVIMTAFGTIEDAVSTMQQGARDYLLKPFSAEAVEQVVRRILTETAEEKQRKEQEQASERPASNGGKQKNGKFVAADAQTKRLLAMADEVANSNATIFIMGESGVGKEVLARYIHHRSSRREQPFVAINCAALPEGLLESELFGHLKGSFTGAILNRKGHFEMANHGTILLDEISEMPMSLQVKLLRVLQEREINPVGAGEPISLDIRVLATTNRNLEKLVEDGGFRQDLYFRLNVIALEIPPLRHRPADIHPLAEHFVRQQCRRNRRPLKKIGRELEQYMLQQAWKGNARELENFIERAVLLCKEEEISPENIFLNGFFNTSPVAGHQRTLDYGARAPENLTSAQPQSLFAGPTLTLEEMEKGLILSTLEKVNGNRTRAADLLGVSVRTIRNKLNHYGLAKTV